MSRFMVLYVGDVDLERAFREGHFDNLKGTFPTEAAARMAIKQSAKRDYVNGDSGTIDVVPDPDWGMTHVIVEIKELVKPMPFAERIKVDLEPVEAPWENTKKER